MYRFYFLFTWHVVTVHPANRALRGGDGRLRKDKTCNKRKAGPSGEQSLWWWGSDNSAPSGLSGLYLYMLKRGEACDGPESARSQCFLRTLKVIHHWVHHWNDTHWVTGQPVPMAPLWHSMFLGLPCSCPQMCGRSPAHLQFSCSPSRALTLLKLKRVLAAARPGGLCLRV